MYLGLSQTTDNVCLAESEGSNVLVDLLPNNMASAPLLSAIYMIDFIATTVWHIWWERMKATHVENAQDSVCSAQAIFALALNCTRTDTNKNTFVARHRWRKPL